MPESKCLAVLGPAALCHAACTQGSPTCAEHAGWYEHDRWVATFLGAAAPHYGRNLQQYPKLASHVMTAFYSKGVRLTAADFHAAPPLQKDTEPYVWFAHLVIASHDDAQREWCPDLWDCYAGFLWSWRAFVKRIPQPPPGIYTGNAEVARLIKKPSDLTHFVAAIRRCREPLRPEFAATRPPYMSREPEQREPSSESYMALFEHLLVTHEFVATLAPHEVDDLLTPYEDLPSLRHATLIIKRRWDYERERFWTRRRLHFKRTLAEDIIAEACHPRRVAWVLERHGYEGVQAMFD